MAKAPARAAVVEVRILAANAPGYPIDTVVPLAPTAAAAAVREGWADSHPEAVAAVKARPQS
jgi:hypothetical protein